MKKIILGLFLSVLAIMIFGMVGVVSADDYRKGIIIIAAVDNVTVEELNNLVALHNLTWDEGSPITTYGPLRGYVIVLEGEEQSWIEIFENESIIKYASLSPIVRLACSPNNLELCSNKTSCESVEGFWYDNKCNEEQHKTKNDIEKPKNITFVPWQKRNESECLQGCKCVGAVMSCEMEDGKTMTIEAGRSGNIITITVGQTEVNTKLELEQESENNKTKLKAKLSNGRKAEIKIMPETASEKAIERLGELGFTIELKEVGKGDEAKPVYELTGNKEGKFLGIFKIMARVQAQVDAETGEVKVKKPWWSFLASGI